MKILRKLIGQTILFLDRIFEPKKVFRSPDLQAQTDVKTKKLSLYQFEACPFCVKVRRSVRRLNLNIELRDVLKNKKYEEELVQQGGQYQVPCLRIENESGSAQWLYESTDIINFLEKSFPINDS